ncbi:MAG TPA: EamA family transporter [Actinomycetota bacterium]
MDVDPWVVPALVALVVWSVQRVFTKAALSTLSTPQFYLLSASLSLPVYLPMLFLDPPRAAAFVPALGVSAFMAVAFGVTTEALRRGPLGRVSPITGVAPALTAVLAVMLLHEQAPPLRLLGITLAIGAVVLLGYRCTCEATKRGWLSLTIAALLLQGLGAFLAKAVVTPFGPSALLVTSAGVQMGVGSVLLRRSGGTFPRPTTPLLRWTFLVLVLAALATIGYLWALSVGPASAVVPLVATSPALAGVVGAIVLKEPRSRMQYWGIGLGMFAAALLALG